MLDIFVIIRYHMSYLRRNILRNDRLTCLHLTSILFLFVIVNWKNIGIIYLKKTLTIFINEINSKELNIF